VECAWRFGLLVVAEVPFEPEEGSFVKVIAEKRKRDGDCHDNDGSSEYGKRFGVKMIVDIEPGVSSESFVHRVVEDVKAIAVFAEETQRPVRKETLGLRAGTQRHGDERGEGDRYEGEAEGGDEKGMLPEEAVAKIPGK
jgi:hypothetical protein